MPVEARVQALLFVTGEWHSSAHALTVAIESDPLRAATPAPRFARCLGRSVHAPRRVTGGSLTAGGLAGGGDPECLTHILHPVEAQSE